MPVQKLIQYLESQNVPYERIHHVNAYTAQETAQSVHVAGKQMAKTVIVKIADEMAMFVLPAIYKVDLEGLQALTGSDQVRLATEDEFKARFPDCEIGAMPPFGNLYDMRTFMASVLSEDKEIWFNAGTHTELLRMSFADYERLVQPEYVGCYEKAI